MAERVYVVRAEWDRDAKVWIAISDDIPGLAAEADTFDELVSEIKLLIPDLLELNCGIQGPTEVSLLVTSHREERIRVPAA